MTNEEKMHTATTYLDLMLSAMRADLTGCADPTPDQIAVMADELMDDDPDWIASMMWAFAIAQIRLARGTTS